MVVSSLVFSSVMNNPLSKFLVYMGAWLVVVGGVCKAASTLRVAIYPQKVWIGFGPFGRWIPLAKVSTAKIDAVSSIWRYGGVGLKVARVGGKWRLAFISGETPRVVLELKEGLFKEVVFSTASPSSILEVLKEIGVGHADHQ